MLGMIIGISSVIIIMSIGASAQDLILDQIRGVGSDLIGILPGASSEGGPPAAVLGVTVTTLKYDDILTLTRKENVPYAKAAAAYVKGKGTVSWQNRSIDININGTTASYIEVEDTEVELGRFFSPEEERGISRVAVLGSEAYKDLFQGQNPIGQNIKIKREQFRVIGVMKERGSVAFQNEDNQIFVPLETAQKLLLGINHLAFARVKVIDSKYLDQTVEDIKITLRQRHGIENPENDDFTVTNVQSALDVFTGVTTALKFFLASIAAIALLVGGIGIMNIMLVAVNERIREIGLRKAVGARSSTITRQFLVETIAISFGGGLIGIFFGIIISLVIALVANNLGYNWNFIIMSDSIILASVVSIAVGLLFGIYPAKKAAKLDPIDALRYE